MKLRHCIVVICMAVLPAAPTLAIPLGTSFTYQGQLIQNGNPVNGVVDLRFSLWNAAGSGTPPSGGIKLGVSQLVNSVAVSNGLLVVMLNEAGEFGPFAFNGDARWLQIEVCGNPACGTSTVMAPRQPITPTPYASFSAGPWQSGSGNVYFSDGKVGIGTSTPTAHLDARSSGQVTLRAVNNASGPDPSFAASFRAEGSTPENRAGSFIANGPGTNYAGFFNATGGVNNYAIWSENGINHFRQRVGIGTTTPNNPLSVFGNVDVFGFVGIGNVPAPTSALSIQGVGLTSTSSALNVANASGTSALFVRDDLRVGIGTTNPLHKLQIGGNFDGHLGFGPSDVSPNAGYIRFGDNTGWKLHLGRARESSAGSINTGTVGAIMTLVDQGNVGIGTTIPSQRLHVVGNICATGTIGACSDVRFKERIVPLGHSLSNILSLQGVSFTWKPDEYPGMSLGTGNQIGLIAQEVERIYPEVVQTGSDGYKSVDYARLTPVLIEAIRELNAKNEKLEAQLTALAGALRSLIPGPENPAPLQESEP